MPIVPAAVPVARGVVWSRNLTRKPFAGPCKALRSRLELRAIAKVGLGRKLCKVRIISPVPIVVSFLQVLLPLILSAGTEHTILSGGRDRTAIVHLPPIPSAEPVCKSPIRQSPIRQSGTLQDTESPQQHKTQQTQRLRHHSRPYPSEIKTDLSPASKCPE